MPSPSIANEAGPRRGRAGELRRVGLVTQGEKLQWMELPAWGKGIHLEFPQTGRREKHGAPPRSHRWPGELWAARTQRSRRSIRNLDKRDIG